MILIFTRTYGKIKKTVHILEGVRKVRKHAVLRKLLCAALCVMIAVTAFPVSMNAAGEEIKDKMVEALRGAMTRRTETLKATYTGELLFSEDALTDNGKFNEAVNALLQEIYNRAIAHTGAGKEGDYLRWHVSSSTEGLSLKYVNDGPLAGNYEYTVEFQLEYYTDGDQETAVTTAYRRRCSS